MMEKQNPASYAKNLLSIYNGNIAAAIGAVKSARDSRDPYWLAVIESLCAEVTP